MDKPERVCLCRQLFKSDLAQAVAEGADTLEAVQIKTGAATACGRCRARVLACLEEILAENE